MKKKILYVDMDGVLVDFQTGIDQLSEKEKKEYAGKLDEVPGIFALMKPKPDAIESFKQLSKIYDTYVLSTAPWENPSAWTDKLNWIKNYLGKEAYKRLILSHNKHLNSGDYLIDDRKANGAEHFPGQHIYFGKDEFPDWKSVCDYLISQSI